MIERRLIADLPIELNRKTYDGYERNSKTSSCFNINSLLILRRSLYGQEEKSCEKNREVSSKYLNVVLKEEKSLLHSRDTKKKIDIARRTGRTM